MPQKKNVAMCLISQNCKLNLGFIIVFSIMACSWSFGGPSYKTKSTSVVNMQQSRGICMALYLENEYEKLVVEAHFDCKQLNNPINSCPSF